MEIQMLQIPVYNGYEGGERRIEDGYFILNTLIAILPIDSTHIAGSVIYLKGGHTIETPIEPEELTDHINNCLEKLYDGQTKTVFD